MSTGMSQFFLLFNSLTHILCILSENEYGWKNVNQILYQLKMIYHRKTLSWSSMIISKRYKVQKSQVWSPPLQIRFIPCLSFLYGKSVETRVNASELQLYYPWYMCSWFYSSCYWIGWCSWAECGLAKTTRIYILYAQEVGYNGRFSVHWFPPKICIVRSHATYLAKNINNKVASVARIGLPFSVQIHIKRKHNVAYKDNNWR